MSVTLCVPCSEQRVTARAQGPERWPWCCTKDFVSPKVTRAGGGAESPGNRIFPCGEGGQSPGTPPPAGGALAWEQLSQHGRSVHSAPRAPGASPHAPARLQTPALARTRAHSRAGGHAHALVFSRALTHMLSGCAHTHARCTHTASSEAQVPPRLGEGVAGARGSTGPNSPPLLAVLLTRYLLCYRKKGGQKGEGNADSWTQCRAEGSGPGRPRWQGGSRKLLVGAGQVCMCWCLISENRWRGDFVQWSISNFKKENSVGYLAEG